MMAFGCFTLFSIAYFMITVIRAKSTSEQPNLDDDKNQKHIIDEEMSGPTWRPYKWNETLENMRKVQKDFQRPPTNFTQCLSSADLNETPKDIRYQILIALILSSQNKEAINHFIFQRWKKLGLTIDKVLEMSEEDLIKLIKPTRFWKRKAKYIKLTSRILKDSYNSDIPDTYKELCQLPGMGSKMATICMNLAWNKVVGIGVDNHVHRISNRLGWVNKTKNLEATRKALECWLPKEIWSEINHIMVGFGQVICRPINPRCDTCLNLNYCPSADL